MENLNNKKDILLYLFNVRHTYNNILLKIQEEYDEKVARSYKEYTNIELLKDINSLRYRITIVDAVAAGCNDIIEFLELLSNDELIKEYSVEVNNNIIKINNLCDEYVILTALSGKNDICGCAVSITSGSGGVEAEDWAGMLARMYLNWALSNKYPTEIFNLIHSIEANTGIKKITFTVTGDYAYGKLNLENGVHRLIRKSPFDKANKRHTSFASVKVTPLLDETIEIDIEKKDLRIETMRGSGAGGQHRNKTDSAVRITHVPTGITAYCQSDRSQGRNKDTAMKVIYGRLYDLKKTEMDESRDKIDVPKNAFGSQIRTYCLHPTQFVKDHRTKYTEHDFVSVLGGSINKFLHNMILTKLDKGI